MDYQPKYLVCVDSSNHNKFYKMIPHGDGWTAEYGRVGCNKINKVEYSKSQFDKKYNEKIRKGYLDQTDLAKDLIKKDSNHKYKDISNSSVRRIIERLQSFASKAVSENYTISSNSVTQRMIDEAQIILAKLANVKDHDIDWFNEVLVKLYNTIPRKMARVQDYLATDKSQFADIIVREQDLLDVMKGQVIQNTGTDNDVTDDNNTILDALGLVIDDITDSDEKLIKNLLGSCSDQYANAWRVTNLKTQKRFDDFVNTNNILNKKQLWHGSRNENWWSIIQTGLLLKPTNVVITGKMFGNGIYFAPKARKSLGYTSLQGSYWANGSSNVGFMAIMDCAYGIPYDVNSFDSKYYSFNWNQLRSNKSDATCLHAHAGSMLRNDEIVIYKEDQTTIRYLVELGE